MSRLDGRVRKLEARVSDDANRSHASGKVWIKLKDGRMCGADGEVLSREEFEQRRLHAGVVLILPDNGRDDLEQLLGQGHN
jgi:hypothetical protein